MGLLVYFRETFFIQLCSVEPISDLIENISIKPASDCNFKLNLKSMFMYTLILLFQADINFISLQNTIVKFFLISIAVLFTLLFLIFIGNLMIEKNQKMKKSKEQKKSLKEIIMGECKVMRHRKINLGIYVDNTYYLANKIGVYWRAINEYYIVLYTDKGYLADIYFDSFHAYDEFIFICNEDEIAKEGKQISINLFSFKLFDNNPEMETNVLRNTLIPQNSSAA